MLKPNPPLASFTTALNAFWSSECDGRPSAKEEDTNNPKQKTTKQKPINFFMVYPPFR